MKKGTLDREWSGRPESVLRFFKKKYGVKVMREIAVKVLGKPKAEVKW